MSRVLNTCAGALLTNCKPNSTCVQRTFWGASVYEKLVGSDFNENNNMRFVQNNEAAYSAYALPCTYLYTRKLALTTSYS